MEFGLAVHWVAAMVVDWWNAFSYPQSAGGACALWFGAQFFGVTRWISLECMAVAD